MDKNNSPSPPPHPIHFETCQITGHDPMTSPPPNAPIDSLVAGGVNGKRIHLRFCQRCGAVYVHEVEEGK